MDDLTRTTFFLGSLRLERVTMIDLESMHYAEYYKTILVTKMYVYIVQTVNIFCSIVLFLVAEDLMLDK